MDVNYDIISFNFLLCSFYYYDNASLSFVIKIFVKKYFFVCDSRCNENFMIVSVIGDEILKGQAKDTNSHFFCRHLFALGVKVKEVCFI